MWNLKKFRDNSTYANYIKGDDVWLPRVAYILNTHVENINPNTHRDDNEGWHDWSTLSDDPAVVQNPSWGTGLARGGDNKRWVDFTRLGDHFIEIANGGTMYFKDIQDETLAGDDSQNNGWYRASVSDGVLTITTPEGKATCDGSTIQFINYPNDIYSYGGKYVE